ncbi:HpcH/HpaI aldolase/citrate lyase family protein [Rhodococcus koreensis]|uniref:HpcH/HpaI aldolase/citrate lyase family protein n=1 Tax=Rhodococcus koreensis TaxID=99653 RepID=UPI00197CBC41|nr:CoA ester lyase [Rhodococcus koreensis]QSE86076.1 CoA ester lyase [Rhodococcus koreensis]
MLFVPGTKPDWLDKARRAGADAVIFDLEDAVPENEKATALNQVADIVRDAGTHTDQPRLFVRINPVDCWSSADAIRRLVSPGLAGIVLPKVDTDHEVRVVDALIGWSEQEQHLPSGSVALMPVLETAKSLRDAHAIAAASQRVAYLGAVTGAGGDVARAVGFRWSPENTETIELRARVLLDVRAAGSPNPITGLWTRVNDLPGLRAFAEQNRSLGYEGMVAIHPTHIPVINEVFSPTTDELARLQRLLTTVEQAQAAGSGVVAFEGEMVDEAMAETARMVLQRFAPTPTD